MIYLELFWTFLQIGLFSFGGGYGMISVIRDQCLAHSWISEESLINYIAVAESTPGPIAVNMATIVGADQGGVLGALLATLGVVLPSFCIILLIVAVMNNLMKYAGVKAGLGAVQPVVIGLILFTGISMLMSMLFGFSNLQSTIVLDWRSIVIFALIVAISYLFKKVKGKTVSPIFLIGISAVLGMLFFGVL